MLRALRAATQPQANETYVREMPTEVEKPPAEKKRIRFGLETGIGVVVCQNSSAPTPSQPSCSRPAAGGSVARDGPILFLYIRPADPLGCHSGDGQPEHGCRRADRGQNRTGPAALRFLGSETETGLALARHILRHTDQSSEFRPDLPLMLVLDSNRQYLGRWGPHPAGFAPRIEDAGLPRIRMPGA